MPIPYLLTIILVILITSLVFYLHKLLDTKKSLELEYEKLDFSIQKRWNSIPRFIEIIRPYIEGDPQAVKSIEEMILLRNTTYDNMNERKKIAVDLDLADKIPRLLALAQQKGASETRVFQNLKAKLEKLEEEISHRHGEYAKSINRYNRMLTKFPTNILAKILKCSPKEKVEYENRK